MNQWPTVSLGELLDRSNEPAVLDMNEQYHEVTVKLWGKGVISRGRVRGSEVGTTRRFVRTNQLILSKIDARNGAVGIVPPELDGAIVSNDFPTFTVRDPNRLSADFVALMAKSTFFVELCKAASEGTTNRVRITEGRFLEQRVPLPPLAKQRAVVAKHAALTDKTNQVAAHLDAIEAAASALVLALHHSLARGRLVPLSEVIELHEEPVQIRLEETYPQVGVRSFGGGLFPKPAVSALDTTYRTFNRLYQNAIVLSQVKGWEGAIAMTPPNLVGMFASPEYRTFRCIPGRAIPEYLAEIFRTPWFWSLLQNATRGVGARRERTRPEQFVNVTMPMPLLKDQEQAAQLFSQLNALKARHKVIREANAGLLPATLERLFA